MSIHSFMNFLSLTICGLMVNGCSLTIPLNPKLETLPEIVPLPITMGIYYTPEFSNYQYVEVGDPSSVVDVVYPLGKASRTIFEKLFSAIFQETHILSTPTSIEHASKGFGIIEATIESFEAAPHIDELDEAKNLSPNPLFWAEITYRFTLYWPRDTKIATWFVSGVSEANPEISFFNVIPPFREATERAILDAADKLAREIRGVPELQEWLRTVETASGE